MVVVVVMVVAVVMTMMMRLHLGARGQQSALAVVVVVVVGLGAGLATVLAHQVARGAAGALLAALMVRITAQLRRCTVLWPQTRHVP